LSRHSRLDAILELLSQRGKLDVEELVQELGVSAATVRRDLDRLADQQLLTRTHGGAVPTAASYDLPLRYKATRYADAKLRIAQTAAAMVRAGEVVGFNGGTTTTEVARALARRVELADDSGHAGLIVVTNALNIATELAVRRHIKIVSLGGVARPQSYELIGPIADASLALVNVDLLFLGVDGFDLEHGATASHEGEAGINRKLAESAGRVVVVADHSKLGRSAFARICEASQVDVLLTDAAPEDEMAAGLTERGVEVIVAA
jgi:DeoR family transcriptional regulator of aga operon